MLGGLLGGSLIVGDVRGDARQSDEEAGGDVLPRAGQEGACATRRRSRRGSRCRPWFRRQDRGAMRCGAPTGGRQTTTGFPFPAPTTDTVRGLLADAHARNLIRRRAARAIGFLTPGGPAKVAPNATRGTQTRAVHEARTLHISTHRHHGRPRHPGAQAQRHDPRRLDRRHPHRSLRVPRRAGRPVQVIAPRARIARRGGGVRVRGEG